MQEFISTFITEYGSTIIYTILTAIMSYLGVCVKNAYTKYINTKTKEQIATTVVNAVEQIYKDCNGEEKLEKAIESITEMLIQNNIVVNELEVRMLIEATVNSFNQGLTKDKNKEAEG